MKPSFLSWPLIVAFSLSAAQASAKPKIEISITVSKEIVETKGDGKTTKRVEVKKANPGDLLLYTLTYVNRGDEEARNAVVDNAVPEGATYLGGSAVGDGAEITFSNDGGRTYARATMLTYEVRSPTGSVEKRTATPDQYTHLRWTVASVPPQASGTLSFQVKVK